jgi:hypothetical protein
VAEFLEINTKDFAKFVSDLKSSGLTSDAEMAKQLGKAFSQGGKTIAALAKSNASFSSRIPSSIKARRSGARVSVQAGGPTAPDAAPLDNKGRGGLFRHPVFGNKNVWVNQPARPFLQPALEKGAPGVIEELNVELDRTFRKVF